MFSLLATALQAQDGFGTYLRNVIQTQEKGILVYAKLIEACGLCDSLDLIRDEVYEQRYQKGQIEESYFSNNAYATFYTPEHRKFGYTLFAETDDFWENALGKDYKAVTASDVAAYILQNCYFTKNYNNNEDYSNPENALYQFVTYHLLNRRLTPDRLVNHYNEKGYNPRTSKLSVAVCEYYTTMGDRRLLRTFESAESQGVCLNRFPVLDDSRQGTYHELSCDPDKTGILVGEPSANLINAIIYPINQLLAFDEVTAHNMGSIRLRMDVASIFPEMANNDIRLSELKNERHKNVYLPCDQYQYPYLDDLTVNNRDTYICYWTGRDNGWQNMQGDEFCITGLSDFTLRLPPVPDKGTYELRLAQQTGGNSRGICQFYFGTDPDNLSPLGLPIDLRQSGDNSLHSGNGNIPSNIGYVADTKDEYSDQMTDNELHENGFMKGCNQYCAGGPGASSMMRASNICLRRILGKMTMDPDQTYYLRIKSVLDYYNKTFYMDYIELCPESVYDNPEKPEDIW